MQGNHSPAGGFTVKMRAPDFQRLQTACNAVLTANPGALQDYAAGRFPRADKVRDLQRRFAFDVFAAACRVDSELSGTLYEYCTDDNINTALQRIVPTIPSPTYLEAM